MQGSDGANVTAVSLNGDGSVLAWGEDTRLIGLWDLSTDQRIGESLTGHRELIADLEFADIDGDGTDGVLISTSHDATTRVWELGQGAWWLESRRTAATSLRSTLALKGVCW